MISDTPTVCQSSGCEREVRMALRTERSPRDVLKTTVYYDNRSAPKTATRYCKAHGAEIMAGMISFATDGDNIIGEDG